MFLRSLRRCCPSLENHIFLGGDSRMYTKQDVCSALANGGAEALAMAFDFARQQNSGLTAETKQKVLNLQRKKDTDMALRKILCHTGGGRRTRRAKRSSRRTRHAKRQ